MCIFQVGDLVTYDPNNKWAKKRDQNFNVAKIGVVLTVSKYKDDHQDELQIQWNGGEEKIYFEEELSLLSRTTDDEFQFKQAD